MSPGDYNVITLEGNVMRARLVKIGNSRGIRLPKPVIEQAGLDEEVSVEVRDGAVIISSAKQVRAGWSVAARLLRVRNADRLVDEPVATRFDEREWKRR